MVFILGSKWLTFNDTNRFGGGGDFHAIFQAGGERLPNGKVEEIALKMPFLSKIAGLRQNHARCGISRAKWRFCKSRPGG